MRTVWRNSARARETDLTEVVALSSQIPAATAKERRIACSTGSSAMLGYMTRRAERNQILLGVLSRLTAESLVVHFKVR
jgi:hypothetical protein